MLKLLRTKKLINKQTLLKFTRIVIIGKLPKTSRLQPTDSGADIRYRKPCSEFLDCSFEEEERQEGRKKRTPTAIYACT